MFDCNDDIVEFFNTEVTLSKSQQDEMRARRDANRKRLKDGLDRNNKPTPIEHIAQGSYAMHTMVNDDENDYDIDDGAVSRKADLVGDRGAELSALDARKMVRDALDDGSFIVPPEVKTNCVRVHYQAGYHVDVPVYRKLEDGSLELASSDWKGSSPTEVTEWFKQAVIDKSPDTTNGRQMRRVTRLHKFHMKSRDSWKNSMPSGFELSVLVDEKYIADANCDDVSLYNTMAAIHSRLVYDLEIKHPIRDEMLTNGDDDANTRFLRGKLSEAIENLEILHEADCTRLDALKAWNSVYKHDFWKKKVFEEEQKQAKKEETASLLRGGNSGLAVAAGLLVAGAAVATVNSMKNTRAYGGKKHR